MAYEVKVKKPQEFQSQTSPLKIRPGTVWSIPFNLLTFKKFSIDNTNGSIVPDESVVFLFPGSARKPR